MKKCGGEERESVYLNHALLFTYPLFLVVVIVGPISTGRFTPEHKVSLHAHDPLYRAVTAIFGHGVLDLDDVANAHAAAASVAFRDQDAVASHGERGHHGRALGGVDGDYVRADKVHACRQFEGCEQRQRQVAQDGHVRVEKGENVPVETRREVEEMGG